MDIVLMVVEVVFGILFSLSSLICTSSIISHIVRRHVLFDRQHDIVSRINWQMKQQGDTTEIEALKFEEQNVFSTMNHHKHLIVMNIVNIILLLVFAVIITIVFYAVISSK